ncbi:hypothetical protein BKG95_01645 [Rodentibacter pneumotropicus]|uniref:Type II secretion system protein GspD n=1 Tax=Rodentibacter pneumotropicus TaxID=758 RepID=A0AAW5LAX4_9PAST|nr:hypothetical protein [Rodentibacter pneumotropicus]MCQ9120814.1 type II secretion system protein GspD [Rodentibacter pneumotropicus]OOF68992.1 hypothetical protein BKG95_01645 [Rodentibacter pneumotropicus]
MKIRVVLLLTLLFACFAKADNLKVDDLELKRAIGMIYEEFLNRPYMLDPNVLELNKKVSFYLTDNVNKEDFFKRYFNNMNIKVHKKNGVDYLKYVEPVIKIKGHSFVYKPRFRGVEYLSDNIRELVTSSSEVNENQRFKGSINSKGDVLVVHADQETINKVKKVLPMLDIKPAQVVVTARILEVKKGDSHQSGLSILANILKSKLSLNFSIGNTSDNLISLKTSDVNALFSIFDTESRFNVISSPVIRVLDSENGSFVVGSDVPVLGAESYQDGVRTRSIDYRSSGVIFNIKPTITDNGVKVNVRSELSNFARTETGVNDTPTLLKRLVDSTVYVNDGSLVILGGLSEEKMDKTDQSAFGLPSWIFGKSKKFEKSDILLLMHTRIVNDSKNEVNLDHLMRKFDKDNLF